MVRTVPEGPPGAPHFKANCCRACSPWPYTSRHVTLNLWKERVTRRVFMATYSSTKEECFWSVWLFPVTPSIPLSALISCVVSLFFYIFLKVLLVSVCLSRLLHLKLPFFSGFCNSFSNSSLTYFFPLQETSATPLGSSSPIIKLIPIELLRCPPDKGPCLSVQMWNRLQHNQAGRKHEEGKTRLVFIFRWFFTVRPNSEDAAVWNVNARCFEFCQKMCWFCSRATLA